MTEVSTKPYLMRAIYEWCIDHSLTPYLTVQVNSMARVPMEFVRDGRITFNISPAAVNGLVMDNHWIRFSARFGGVVRQIEVPVDAVESLFSRENGQGLSFQIPDTAGDVTEEGALPQDPERVSDSTVPKDGGKDDNSDHEPPKPGRPRLHVVK